MFLRNGRWQADTLLATCFRVGFLLDLLFDPEDGGAMFLWNISWLQWTTWHIPEDTTLHNHHCWEPQILQKSFTFPQEIINSRNACYYLVKKLLSFQIKWSMKWLCCSFCAFLKCGLLLWGRNVKVTSVYIQSVLIKHINLRRLKQAGMDSVA
jgi:hypothetical protein